MTIPCADHFVARVAVALFSLHAWLLGALQLMGMGGSSRHPDQCAVPSFLLFAVLHAAAVQQEKGQGELIADVGWWITKKMLRFVCFAQK